MVRLNGRDYYLGPYNSPASWEKYGRLIQSWMATGEVPAAREREGEPVGLTVAELILAFLKHAEAYYRRPDGTPTGEYTNVVIAVRPLKQLFGNVEARSFGPKSLKAVRDAMIGDGLCRNVVNQLHREDRARLSLGRGKRDGARRGPPRPQGCGRVAEGRTVARETEPVKPVPEADVEALRAVLAPQVWAMVELQRLSGMRPGEVTIMRTGDIDRSGTVWTYTPGRHKTEHHGKARAIHLGPQRRRFSSRG